MPEKSDGLNFIIFLLLLLAGWCCLLAYVVVSFTKGWDFWPSAALIFVVHVVSGAASPPRKGG